MTFQIGDTVRVLRASRLPVEETLGTGEIVRTSVSGATRLYWISGFPMPRQAFVLRLVTRHSEVA